MSWKTASRSFHDQNARSPRTWWLLPAETSMLSIDVQNTYLAESATPRSGRAGRRSIGACGRW